MKIITISYDSSFWEDLLHKLKFFYELSVVPPCRSYQVLVIRYTRSKICILVWRRTGGRTKWELDHKFMLHFDTSYIIVTASAKKIITHIVLSIQSLSWKYKMGVHVVYSIEFITFILPRYGRAKVTQWDR
jgi:hypothetical protein